jgi:hypothetical protein
MSLRSYGNRSRRVFSTGNLPHVLDFNDFAELATRLMTARGSGKSQ